MIKKSLTVLLCSALMVLSLGQAALAGDMAITNEEQALAIAQKLLPEITAGKKLMVELDDDYFTGQKVWRLSLERSYMERNTWLDITLDGKTGDLISFHYQPSYQDITGKLLTKDQAREVAMRFVAQMQPMLVSQMRLEEGSSPYYLGRLDLNYHFQWKRMANGLPVLQDGISVTVDALTGQVGSYYFRWEKDSKFPPPSDKIKSPDEILAKVLENVGVYLSYHMNERQEQTVDLSYKINTNAYYFDHITGQPNDYQGKQQSIKDTKLFTEQFTYQVDEEKTIDSGTAKTLDMASAQRIAEDFFKQLGYKGKVRHSGGGSSTSRGYSIEFWDFSLEDSGDTHISVSINRADGSVVNFHNIGESINNKKGTTISLQQARDNAEKFLTILDGGQGKYIFANTYTMMPHSRDESYRFSYVPLVNGIPFYPIDNSIQINSYTGKVTGYWSHDQGCVIPTYQGDERQIIAPETATAVYLENNPLKLNYIYLYDDNGRFFKETKLVYQLLDKGIDAYTGEPQGVKEHHLDKQLNNHWAREALEMLANNGLLPGENFNPDSQITVRQALSTLSVAIDDFRHENIQLTFDNIAADDPLLPHLHHLAQQGILEKDEYINPDELLTREKLAVWLVKGMGYKNMANLPVKIENRFSDYQLIKKEHQNYVALAAALEIINGDKNGNFNPHQPITWGEFATIITRATPKLNTRD